MKCIGCNSKNVKHEIKADGTYCKCGCCGRSWLDKVKAGVALPGPAEYYVEAATVKRDDAVNPGHYRKHPSGIECIQVTEHMGFCLGNAIKYIWRAGLKDGNSKRQDLEKARWYLDRELAKEQNI